jgi:hypothetical protein
MMLAALLATAGILSAQDVQVLIQVQPTSVELGGQFRMTVTVAGGFNQTPDAKVQGLDQFRIVGSSQASEISIVNGSISSTKRVTYAVLAEQEGTFELGPAEVTVKDKIFRSNTVTITVGRRRPRPRPPAAAGVPPPPMVTCISAGLSTRRKSIPASRLPTPSVSTAGSG